MRIALIHPYFDFSSLGVVNRCVPPLDLAYLASLFRNEGYDVEVIDANALKRSASDPVWMQLSADIFIITTASVERWQCPHIDTTPAKEIIQKLRERGNTPIIVIGPHGTHNSQEFTALGENIEVIRGEPEQKVFEAVTGKKIFFRDFPIPAYDLLPMEKYEYAIMGKNFAIIETSRGCPYQCGFCSKSMYPSYSIRDPDILLEEIEVLVKKFGVKNIEIIDLMFGLDKKFTKIICDGIINKGLHFHWCVNTRVDTLDDEMLGLMKYAGCSLVQLGVESGDEQILEKTGKRIDHKKIIAAFRRIEKRGMKTLAYFIIGNIGETEKDIKKTIKFAKKLNPHYAAFNPMMVYPGAPFFSKVNEYNFYNVLNLSTIEKFQKKAYLAFYCGPKNMLKQISSLRSTSDVRALFAAINAFFFPLVSKHLNKTFWLWRYVELVFFI